MLKTLSASNVRSLLKQANDLELRREEIISIFNDSEQYYLIYFKN